MGDTTWGAPAAPERFERGRRDLRWLMVAPLLAVAGLAYGIGLVWVGVAYVSVTGSGSGLAFPVLQYIPYSIASGLVMGVYGLVCGLVAGLALAYAVGDTGGSPGRRRAVAVAALAHALAGSLVAIGIGGGSLAAVLWWVVLTAAAAAVAGWWHGRLQRYRGRDDLPAH